MLGGRLGKIKSLGTDFSPNTLQLVKWVFFNKGITMRQFEEEFTIPEIIELVQTESYIKEKEKEKGKGK